jgi:formate/nitrite transporter FocA (FNT family)
VITFMAQRGRRRLDELDALRVLALAVIAGGLITVGVFSLVVAAEVDAAGPARVLEEAAFGTGFLFVVLCETSCSRRPTLLSPPSG